ncbi:transposase [Palleronia caenipelagi]|uniref:Transposase n=1 Tax=Palleronia caenipelagi TaxID=2489174 RepID=A0A547QAA1_9RHOB|nr:transposase [Palleronia caenipelagi]
MAKASTSGQCSHRLATASVYDDQKRPRWRVSRRKRRPNMIPNLQSRTVRKSVEIIIYALRTMPERFFNKLKDSRRLATRYGKTARSFLGTIDIVCDLRPET